MVRFITLISSVVLFTFSTIASADVLFEGYSKVLSDGKHVGVVISRYEFDSKKNQFISTYYSKLALGDIEVSESVKAISDSELNPISYEYTQASGSETKTIDAKFNNSQMSGLLTENKKTKKLSAKIEKGTFLSTFLVYLIMKSKTGLQTDTTYDYKAIAEEDGEITSGKAVVGKQESRQSITVYKVLNSFKNSDFISYVSERGEVIATEAPAHSLSTELVAKPQDALKGLKVNENVLKSLFGEVPKGLKNVLSSKTAESLKTAPTKSTVGSGQ